MIKNKDNRRQWRLFTQVEHRRGNPPASLIVYVNKSLIYATMHKQKTPIYKLFRSKASKSQQVAGHKRE